MPGMLLILLSPKERAEPPLRDSKKEYGVYKEPVNRLEYPQSTPRAQDISSPFSSSVVDWIRRNVYAMLFTSLLACILLFTPGGALARASPQDNVLDKRLTYTNVADFETFETPIALAGLYANIGPDGSKSQVCFVLNSYSPLTLFFRVPKLVLSLRPHRRVSRSLYPCDSRLTSSKPAPTTSIPGHAMHPSYSSTL